MILVFILLGILIICILFFLLILLSTFHIKMQDLEVTNMKKNKATNYAIILSIYLGKIKWLSIHFNNEKLRKAYTKMHLEKIDLKKIEKDFKFSDLKELKKLQPKFSYFNLQMKIGTENPPMTAFLVSILASIISIFLPYVSKNISKKNYKYSIIPIYENQNLYKIKFNCIIQIKMVHIINVIYIFLKKRRSDLNDRTTSNRRSYGYSYE